MEENTLNFMRRCRESKELKVTHFNSIDGAHIRLGPKEKCPDTKAVYHSVVLVLPSGKMRAVFFDSVKMQKEWFKRLLNQ